MNAVTDTLADWRDSLTTFCPGRHRQGAGSVLALYLLVAVLLGMYWSIAPAPFDVQEQAAAYAAEDGGRWSPARSPPAR